MHNAGTTRLADFEYCSQGVISIENQILCT